MVLCSLKDANVNMRRAVGDMVDELGVDFKRKKSYGKLQRPDGEV